MKANIRLGLEAGQCVGPAEAPQQGRFPRLDPRFAVVLASASLVVVMGWWLGSSPVPEESEAPEVRAAHAVVLEAGREGVRVQSRGSALSLLAPSREPVTVSVSLEGSARVRYVDAETGQVTIQDVYAE